MKSTHDLGRTKRSPAANEKATTLAKLYVQSVRIFMMSFDGLMVYLFGRAECVEERENLMDREISFLVLSTTVPWMFLFRGSGWCLAFLVIPWVFVKLNLLRHNYMKDLLANCHLTISRSPKWAILLRQLGTA